MTHVPNQPTPVPPEPSFTTRTLLLVGALSLMVGAAIGLMDLRSPRPERPENGDLSPEALKLDTQLAQELKDIQAKAELDALPAPPAPTRAAVLQITATPPEALTEVIPAYPEPARRVHVEGPVNIRVRLDTQGRVIGVESVTGNTALQGTALEAVRQWRFRPATTSGRTVPSDFNVTFNFKLS